MSAARRARRLKKRFRLNGKQTARVERALVELSRHKRWIERQLQAARRAKGGSAEGVAAAVKHLRAHREHHRRYRAQMSGILGPARFARYQKTLKRYRTLARRRERRSQNTARLIAGLGLGEAQAPKVERILAELDEKAIRSQRRLGAFWRGDKELTDEQLRQLVVASHALRQQRQERLKAVLSADQLATLRRLQAKQHGAR